MILLSAFITLVCAGCTPAIQSSPQISSHALIIPVAKRSRRSRAWSICRRKHGRKLTGVTMKKGNRFICHYRKTKSWMRASCRRKYGKRFIKLLKTRKGYACSFNSTRKQFVRLCKRKYGRRYLRVIRKKSKNFCIYQPSKQQMSRTCKKRHGNRFLRLSKSNGRYHCIFKLSRKRALAQCNKTYGNRFLRMSEHKNRRFICWYRPSFEEAVSQCRKNHGNKLIDVIRKDKRYICRFTPDATTQDKHFSTPDDQSADPGKRGGFDDRSEEHGPSTNDEQFDQNPDFPSPATPSVTPAEKKNIDA
ncbi:MAG: hypothetical protein GY927_06135 [bacterium]|nr:hypothetical protein [bacterium]